MNQEQIGKFIAKCRKEKGLTQAEFAEKLGVTDKTVSRWENGHYLPDFSLFEDICNILEINITELLYCEKMEQNIEKREVDNTIMSFINISDKKIKKEKKRIISVSGIIIVIIIISCSLFIHFNKEEAQHEVQYIDTTPNSRVPFPEKIAIKEKDDGWVCSFKLEFLTSDLNTPYYYGYSCDNLKYPKLDGYTFYGKERDSAGEYNYVIETDHPSYLYNEIYHDEILKIDDYFLEKKFNKPITIDDLKDLDIKKISKLELLELFNKAISSEMIEKYGNYPHVNVNPYLIQALTADNYTWQVGFILVHGHICYVNIDLKIGNKYLSDMIEDNTANKEQKLIFDNINKMEEYIIEVQRFTRQEGLRDRPYDFIGDAFGEIENINSQNRDYNY